MSVRPLNDRLVLEREETPKTTASGLQLPPSAVHEEAIAKVIAKGKQVSDEVSVGNRVLYKEYSVTDVTIDDKKLLLIKEEDLLAVID